MQASSVADGVDGEVARLQLGGGPRGALLEGLVDRVGDAAILAGLGLWALDGRPPEGVLVLTVAATTGALLSMASKDRAAALGLSAAPERALGWLLGGRDGRLWLVAVGAVLGARSRPWPRSRPPRGCRSACGSPPSADRRSPNDQAQFLAPASYWSDLWNLV